MRIETIKCPSCDFVGYFEELHSHMAEDHRDLVSVTADGNHWAYEVCCPTCGESYRQPIRLNFNEAEFSQVYHEEIIAVATNVLIGHYIGEHVLDAAEVDTGKDGGPNGVGQRL